MTEENNESDINKLMKNPGLDHIPICILECLDFKSLTACRNVSKEWKHFVDNSTSFWKRHLRRTRKLMRQKQNYHIYNGRDPESDESEDGEESEDYEEHVPHVPDENEQRKIDFWRS